MPVTETSTQTYIGDYEDLDSHIARKNKSRLGREEDLCAGQLDSLALLRGELFAFSGSLMWRFSSRGQLRHGYPAAFSQMFPFLR